MTNSIMPVAVVLGASSAVGRCITLELLLDGWRVYGTYCRGGELVEHENFHGIKLDVESPESVDKFILNITCSETKPVLMVGLLGFLPGKSLANYEEGDIDKVLMVNFSSTAKIIRRMSQFFKRGANIVLISSISSERGSYDPIYAASKGAINSFVKSLATWMAPDVRVNAIAPSLIESTVMYEEMLPARRQLQLDQCPMKSFLQPNDLAKVILDIIKPHWSHLNGVVLKLNGGIYV